MEHSVVGHKVPTKKRTRKKESSFDNVVKRSILLPTVGARKSSGGTSKRGSHHLAMNVGCEVKYYYSYHLYLKPLGGNYYMDYGTLGHTWLSYFYGDRIEKKPQWYLEQPDLEEALEIDAEGNPSWIRSVKELGAAYANWEAGRPLVPLLIEEEVEVTVGALDPNGEDEPAINIPYLDSKGKTVLNKDGTERWLRLPTLNNESVTCRPDLIGRINGEDYILDHKVVSGARDSSKKLPIISDDKPDYTYAWQAMYNLWICRTAGHNIAGFKFNRLKRDIPYDFSRDDFKISLRAYEKVPGEVREMIREERRRLVRIAKGIPPIPRHSECQMAMSSADGKTTFSRSCSFARLCFTDSIPQRNERWNNEYVSTAT